MLFQNKLNLMFNWAADADKLNIRKNYEKDINTIYFQNYLPDLFEGATNEKSFIGIVKEYIIQI